MQIIIRLSRQAQEAEQAKEPPARIQYSAAGDYTQNMPDELTDEQRATDKKLNLSGPAGNGAAFRLGEFILSTVTRKPLVRVIVYDAPPTIEEIWQQLSVMASQYDTMINPSGMVF